MANPVALVGICLTAQMQRRVDEEMNMLSKWNVVVKSPNKDVI